jgi:hypothetical protein
MLPLPASLPSSLMNSSSPPPTMLPVTFSVPLLIVVAPP